MASPLLKEKQQPANGIPPQVRAATRQRAATHVGGGVPDAPEASHHRPSPGKPPGRACPAPTARRWASPMPSINAHGGVKTPPYEPPHQRVPRPISAYVNYIRRAGCPHPAASSRSHPSTGSHPRRGQDPSLRTAPSTSARPPPRGSAGTATKKPRQSLFPGLPRFFI